MPTTGAATAISPSDCAAISPSDCAAISHKLASTMSYKGRDSASGIGRKLSIIRCQRDCAALGASAVCARRRARPGCLRLPRRIDARAGGAANSPPHVARERALQRVCGAARHRRRGRVGPAPDHTEPGRAARPGPVIPETDWRRRSGNVTRRESRDRRAGPWPAAWEP
jgi:hypothetical protein